jgi:hypothetical protein
MSSKIDNTIISLTERHDECVEEIATALSLTTVPHVPNVCVYDSFVDLIVLKKDSLVDVKAISY